MFLTSWHQRALSQEDTSKDLFIEMSYSPPWKFTEVGHRYITPAWSRVGPDVVCTVGVPKYLGTHSGQEVQNWERRLVGAGSQPPAKGQHRYSFLSCHLINP